MIHIKQAIAHAIALLTPTSPTARIDAEILLTNVLDQPRSFLYSHPECLLEPTQWERYHHLLIKRCEGIPIAYLTGQREFWSISLQLSEATLIPRPETEQLVELTLSLLQNVSPATILDLGTGSGAISLALASERPDWQVMAIDISQGALDIAIQNAHRLGQTNVSFLCSDWFSSIPPRIFNAIISNPPYIAEDDPHLQQGDLRFEPQQALSSGAEGLDSIIPIIQQSYDRLLPGGLLLLEHGHQQKQAVMTLLKNSGFERVQSWTDHQCHDRISGGWRKN